MAGCWGRRRRLNLHIGIRQRVAEIESEPCLFPCPDHTLHQELQRPRFGRIKREFQRHREQVDFGKIRCAFGFKVAQPRLVDVAEADAVGVLDQFDAVEDAAADVSSPLERIPARPRDDQRLLTRLQPADQPIVAVIAEQTAADGRHRDVGDIQVDERIGRIALFRMRGRCGIAGFFEGLVHVVHGEEQPTDGTVTDEALPVANLALSGINRLRDLRRRAGDRVALFAEPAALDEFGRGAHDAVAHHQHGHRRATDDIDLRRGRGAAHDASDVGADQLVDRFQDTRDRNAHEHNGFLMLNELETRQHALRIDTDQDLDRLSGVAGGVGKVGIQVDVAEELIILVCGRNRGIALQRPKPSRAGHQFGRLGLAEVIVKPACGARLAKEGHPAEKGQSSKKDMDVDGFSQDDIPDCSSRTPLFWIARSVYSTEAGF